MSTSGKNITFEIEDSVDASFEDILGHASQTAEEYASFYEIKNYKVELVAFRLLENKKTYVFSIKKTRKSSINKRRRLR